MHRMSQEDLLRVGGGVEAVTALPGSTVTRTLLMGSWVPWTYGVAAFAGGFAVGSYIYDNFGTEILDGIEAVVN